MCQALVIRPVALDFQISLGIGGGRLYRDQGVN